MESKVSKAQTEVWEWKEALYNELKNIPNPERLKYIGNKVKETLRQIKTVKEKLVSRD
jgi:hypothetical protein